MERTSHPGPQGHKEQRWARLPNQPWAPVPGLRGSSLPPLELSQTLGTKLPDLRGAG